MPRPFFGSGELFETEDRDESDIFCRKTEFFRWMGHLEEEEDLFSPFNQHLVIKFKAQMGFLGASKIGRETIWSKSFYFNWSNS